MTRVLCIGVATLDIVNRVQRYPREDDEVRAIAQARRMGGNAANTAVVLAQLGADVAWAGNLPSAPGIVDDSFARYRVDASFAVRITGATLPTSYITLSAETGSRTIVHFRELPEYRAADFLALDLGGFDWVHFEGRAIDELALMLTRARSFAGLRVSLEVEKLRPGIEALFEFADLALFSRDYAQSKGFADAAALLRSLPRGLQASCTWGAQGAWAVERDGRLLHEPAPRLETAIDTIGAGDVFNAAMVQAFRSGQTLGPALQASVALAAAQCAREGLQLSDD
ncbi:MAG: ketohexokinase [Gammaproteobacteria bacterium]|nr:ketohexokinase [Gammaproteobacteria bacterium]